MYPPFWSVEGYSTIVGKENQGKIKNNFKKFFKH